MSSGRINAPPPNSSDDIITAPVPSIGLYVAVASLVCALAMAADTVRGYRSRKFWIPCKYFSLNAATMTVIAVAMKLPVDLTTEMPGDADQIAKLSGVALMCVMMANFMPSLGTMDNTELLLNMIALVILVVTITVNVCIQIGTGIVSEQYVKFAVLYIVLMLVLLLISASLALNAPTSKRILEWKYHKMHKRALDDKQGENIVKKLMRNVRKYWIMAETGNPQFVMASSPPCSVASYISVAVSLLQVGYVYVYTYKYNPDFSSDYKWSMKLILNFQTIGVVVGSIAPLFRLHIAINFELSIKWIMYEMKVFRVENYWFKLLEDWKRSPKALQKIRSRGCKKLAHFAKNLILNTFIWFQIFFVMMCKMIRFIPLILLGVYIGVCFHFAYFLFSLCGLRPLDTAYFPWEFQRAGQDITETDPISNFVVQLQDGVKMSKKTVNSISKAVDQLVKKAEKKRPRHLSDLLRKHSTGLHGVSKFENDEIPPFHSEEASSCWSLALVTLTSIAVALLKDESSAVRLLQSVSEGLIYVNHVEENLNIGTDISEAKTAANQVWLDVELEKMWLGNSLQGMVEQGKTLRQILLLLCDTATAIKTKFENSENGSGVGNFHYEFIVANSMYRISQTLLSDDRYRNHEAAVEGLKVMISDILIACFTNIPQVIDIKCHTATIEKREKSVREAAMLIGKTKEILKILEDVQSPALDQWRGASLNRQNPVDPVMQSGSEAITITVASSTVEPPQPIN